MTDRTPYFRDIIGSIAGVCFTPSPCGSESKFVVSVGHKSVTLDDKDDLAGKTPAEVTAVAKAVLLNVEQVDNENIKPRRGRPPKVAHVNTENDNA